MGAQDGNEAQTASHNLDAPRHHDAQRASKRKHAHEGDRVENGAYPGGDSEQGLERGNVSQAHQSETLKSPAKIAVTAAHKLPAASTGITGGQRWCLVNLIGSENETCVAGFAKIRLVSSIDTATSQKDPPPPCEGKRRAPSARHLGLRDGEPSANASPGF